MFSTCMFCNESLRTNGVVEAFPVGRWLAFDAARGRLWVVCLSVLFDMRFPFRWRRLATHSSTGPAMGWLLPGTSRPAPAPGC